MTGVRRAVPALSILTVGITTGVMFCYQLAIMPGLGRLPDREYVAAFQEIDAKLVNPLFVAGTFLGGAVLLIATTALAGTDRRTARFRLLATATVIYGLGVVALTLAFHVPKNDELADVPVATSTAPHLAAARHDFEGPWVHAHVVRTLASVTALALLSAAMVTDATRRGEASAA